MNTYEKSKELSQKMQSCLRVYADMLGAPAPEKKSLYGFVPGLQMTVEEQKLEADLDKLEEGIFQVLFTGGFNAGKSTLLNSLMRKNILRCAIKAETAVITKIVFGRDESITVHMKETDDKSGNSKTRTMSVEDFFKEYRVSQEHPDKFSDVDYVVLHQPEEGIAGNLVQLVDSPGTENSVADTQAARRFAESANAIVHLINSTMAFDMEDKEYIASHYANKQMRNVFFVCNRFDALNEEEQEDLKKSVPEQLKDVFTDKNGKFDEALFQSRVFYTDAYHSLYARLGEKVKTPMGEMYCDDSITGVPEFEQALGTYLTADDRDKEAFRGYMSQLASKYVSAVKKIQVILEAYKKDVDSLISEREAFEGKKQQLTSIIDQIEESCKNCVSGIISSAANEYDSCMNRIKSGWDSHFSKTKIKFGFGDMVGLAWNKKNDAKVKEITKPFADEVQAYVKKEFEKMESGLSKSMDAHVNTLERQLSIQQAQLESLNLPISINDLRQALLGGAAGRGDIEVTGTGVGDANLFQVILGIIGMDPEIVAGGLNGKTSNGKAIVNFLIKNVLEYIAVCVVWWPIGLAMIGHRIREMVRGTNAERNSRAAEILIGMRDETVEAISLEKDRYVMELENQLSAVTRAGVKMADSIRSQVSDYKASLNDTITKLKGKSASLSTETERTDRIKATLLENISEMNKLLNGVPLTDEDVMKLAV